MKTESSLLTSPLVFWVAFAAATAFTILLYPYLKWPALSWRGLSPEWLSLVAVIAVSFLVVVADNIAPNIWRNPNCCAQKICRMLPSLLIVAVLLAFALNAQSFGEGGAAIVVFGLVFSLLIGHQAVGNFIAAFNSHLRRRCPRAFVDDLGINWVVGAIERALAFIAGVGSLASLVGFYMAAKVLVNWPIWPRKTDGRRRTWIGYTIDKIGGYFYYKFLSGTVLSLLFGFAGGLLAKSWFGLKSKLDTGALLWSLFGLYALTLIITLILWLNLPGKRSSVSGDC
ncbi:hypothetical protein J7J84_04980 [bacterium]|nr:hypothetical protein [bacterium]